MVHILKQKADSWCRYFILNREKTAKELEKMGFEKVASLDVRLKQGQYTPAEICAALKEAKQRKMSNISKIILRNA